MTSSKDTKRALIKQLSRYRETSKETMADIANEIGVATPTIYKWFDKTYLPTEEATDRLKIFLASRNMTTPTARISDQTAIDLIKQLRQAKDEHGYTIPEMAEIIGIHEHNLASWFQGFSKPTAMNAYHVMNFLNGRETQTNLFENLFTEQVAKADMSMTLDDGTVYLSSRSVAEWVEKRHGHLVRDIENYISALGNDEQNPKLGYGLTMQVEDYFREDTYQAEDGGRAYKLYWVSRKGCELIANKMTGQKGIKFTAHYIEYFHAMEQAINESAGVELTPQALPTLEQAENNYIDTLAKAIQESSTRAEKVELIERLNKFVSGL